MNEMRAARAERLSVIIQPITSIFGRTRQKTKSPAKCVLLLKKNLYLYLFIGCLLLVNAAIVC